MAMCFIDKYDKLPSRVGWTDVDYLRWRLYNCDHPTIGQKMPIVKLLFPSIERKDKEKVSRELEKAYEQHKIECVFDCMFEHIRIGKKIFQEEELNALRKEGFKR